jgi:hypothetical protein
MERDDWTLRWAEAMAGSAKSTPAARAWADLEICGMDVKLRLRLNLHQSAAGDSLSSLAELTGVTGVSGGG